MANLSAVRHVEPTVIAGLDASIVTMEEVESVPERMRAGKYAPLFQKLLELRPATALRVKLKDQKQVLYVRAVMRKAAKKSKRMLSTSRSADGQTLYLWLEKDKG